VDSGRARGLAQDLWCVAATGEQTCSGGSGFQSRGTDENDIVNEHGHDIIRSLNDDKIVVISYMFSTFHNSNILIQVSS